MRLLVTLLLANAAAPALAQDHSGHAMPAQPTQSEPQSECEREAARHRAMGHTVAEDACAPASEAGDHAGMDHSGMDHSGMDHSQMGHGAAASAPAAPAEMDHSAMGHGQTDQDNTASGQMDHGAMDHAGMEHGAMNHGTMGEASIPQGPPPAAAGSGPPRAADAIWGAEAMRASRETLRDEHGGMTFFWFQGDRAEYRAREGRDGYLWDLQGWYGGDIDKFWFKSEGEGSFGEQPKSAEVQGLWSHAIGPWFDLQAGVRQDLTGPTRTHGVIGVQGLAPYLFEIDAAAFLSTEGDLTARIEAELDQRITQRLILQPRAEANLSAQDIRELGTGAGLDSLELGLRLRYEIAREFAPYVGIEQEWKTGRSADFARAAGEDQSVTNYVVGLRFWF